MSDHSSRRTWDSSHPRFGLGVQTGVPFPLSWSARQLLFYKVFTKTHNWGSRGTLDPIIAPHTPVEVGVPGQLPPQEPSPLEDHLSTKFHPHPSSGLDFHREHTDRQTKIALYVLEEEVMA